MCSLTFLFLSGNLCSQVLAVLSDPLPTFPSPTTICPSSLSVNTLLPAACKEASYLVDSEHVALEGAKSQREESEETIT